MSVIRTDVSLPALIDAVETNLFAAGPLLFGNMPGAEYVNGPDMIRFATSVPHPMLNGVFNAQLTPENLHAQIREALDYFQACHLPMMWWIGPGSRPENLGCALEAEGLTRAGEMPGMAIDLAEMDADVPTPAGLLLEEVENVAALRKWTQVCCRGFGMPPEISEIFCAAMQKVGFGKDRPLRNFLGSHNGVPVACVSLCLVEGSAGIYCVATVPEARRRGYAAAVVRAALLAARARRYRIGVLEASKMGESVYRRMGFREVCKIGTYHWYPADMAPEAETVV